MFHRPKKKKQPQNTKEKCRKFLANLLELSSREPRQVERNVRTLIQELIDANVEPEEFCDRLERLLNASPQPCLIGFLKKSLPLLRQSMVTKDLVIEGIRAPPHHIAFGGPVPPLPVSVFFFLLSISTNMHTENTNRISFPSTVSHPCHRSDDRHHHAHDHAGANGQQRAAAAATATAAHRPDDNHAAHGARSDTGPQSATAAAAARHQHVHSARRRCDDRPEQQCAPSDESARLAAGRQRTVCHRQCFGKCSSDSTRDSGSTISKLTPDLRRFVRPERQPVCKFDKPAPSRRGTINKPAATERQRSRT